MPFWVNDLTVGFEDALASFLEARLQQANLDFEDAQAVCWRHREGSIGWTVSVRRSSATPHGFSADPYHNAARQPAQDTIS